MNRRDKINIPSHFVLLTLLIFCIALLFFSYATGFSGGPLQTVADYVFKPMQQGLNSAGEALLHSSEDRKSRKELMAENEQLKNKVTELESRLTNVQLKDSELKRLEELYKLDRSYSNYHTTGARIIAKGTSNWFHTFTINKGSKDGIKRNMNVLAGDGLCGVVTTVGANYSVVRSVIADDTNISAMIVSTEDNCIVSGNLERMNESNMIDFSGLSDTGDKVKEGDAVVTSNISSKYLPGILIGYVSSSKADSNQLTKSGTITPVVDFSHLTDVLVITQLKETGASSVSKGVSKE
ncbi:rod shape-determining protein MreC [Lachnospiraceae bacterium KHCPX20]|nr:rod shape-determining protein MreC [Lachnospiraceae bacterium KHCPX20]